VAQLEPVEREIAAEQPVMREHLDVVALWRRGQRGWCPGRKVLPEQQRVDARTRAARDAAGEAEAARAEERRVGIALAQLDRQQAGR